MHVIITFFVQESYRQESDRKVGGRKSQSGSCEEKLTNVDPAQQVKIQVRATI
jgi:hypothetical protein